MNVPRRVVIFGTVVVVIALLVAYFYVVQMQESSTPSSVSIAKSNMPANVGESSDTPTSTSPKLAISSLTTYTNSHYGFAFQYPSGITIDTSADDPGDLTFDFPDDTPYPELLLSVEQPDQHNIDDYFYSPTVAGDGGSEEISLYDIAQQSQEDIATTTLGGVTAIETSFKCGIAYPETIDNGDPTGETIIFAIYDNNLYQLDAPNTCSNPMVLSTLKEVQQSFKFSSD